MDAILFASLPLCLFAPLRLCGKHSQKNEALNVFARGLSNQYRLKEYMRGNFAYKWTVAV